MAQAEIRGEPEIDKELMLLDVRDVFDPYWIQALDSGRILIVFKGRSDEILKAAERMMELEGYTLSEHETFSGDRLYFE